MKLFFVKLLFVTGIIREADSVVDWAASIAAASAAASAVTSGVTVMKVLPNYDVVCAIEVENWTKYPLFDPTSHINGGILKSSPVAIQPGKREMFIAHKTGYTATGTYGTASWLITTKKKRAVVMWSCPYDFNWYSNWLGVGLTKEGVTQHEDWFSKMYTGSSTEKLKFTRGEYYYHTKTISIKDDDFVITGTMGTSHKARARITIRPLREEDLADQLKIKAVTRNLVTKNLEDEERNNLRRTDDEEFRNEDSDRLRSRDTIKLRSRDRDEINILERKKLINKYRGILRNRENDDFQKRL